MKNIQTEIEINASPALVWDVLTNFDNYPNWNPFIQSIRGDKRPGSILTVAINPPSGKVMTFKPKILQFNPQSEFRWKGKLGINGIFDGEHYFMLHEQSEGKTRFIHGEKFTGLLIPFMSSVLKQTEEGFHQMNIAIKNVCERL